MPSVGEQGVERRGESSCSQVRFSFFLWNCCSTERPEGKLGILGLSSVEDTGLEGTVELPDQLKALRLARCGGVSTSVFTCASALCVSPASEGTWSNFSAVSDSSFSSLGPPTPRSDFAKNLQKKHWTDSQGSSNNASALFTNKRDKHQGCIDLFKYNMIYHN